MELKNDSNYPVTVNGVRIESGETEDVEIEDVEKYKNDRRFLLEEDDEQPESEDVESEDEEENDDEEISKPQEKNSEQTGD
jgi:hypothetical protein